MDKDIDISGLSIEEAQEYLISWIVYQKQTRKDLDACKLEIETWQKRLELVRSKEGETGIESLLASATEKLNLLKIKEEELSEELKSTEVKIDLIKERVKLARTHQRSLDPELLNAELQIMAGELPGDEDKIKVEEEIKEMEKKSQVDTDLENLKKKIL